MRGISAALLAGVLTLVTVAPASGQTQTNRQPKRVCFRGRPAEFCRAFWLTEAGFYRRLSGSDFVEVSPSHSFTRAHLGSYWSWEIGGMVNRSSRSALGATVLLGFGGRAGLKGRYRRWLDRDIATLDLSAGVLKADVGGSYPEPSRGGHGMTADVALGLGDLFAMTARADLLRHRDGQMANAVYGGVRLGSYPAVAGTAAAAIIIGTLVALVFSGEDF